MMIAGGRGVSRREAYEQSPSTVSSHPDISGHRNIASLFHEGLGDEIAVLQCQPSIISSNAGGNFFCLQANLFRYARKNFSKEIEKIAPS